MFWKSLISPSHLPWSLIWICYLTMPRSSLLKLNSILAIVLMTCHMIVEDPEVEVFIFDRKFFLQVKLLWICYYMFWTIVWKITLVFCRLNLVLDIKFLSIILNNCFEYHLGLLHGCLGSWYDVCYFTMLGSRLLKLNSILTIFMCCHMIL